MMEIKPRIVGGEPVCDAKCAQSELTITVHWDERYRCKLLDTTGEPGDPCVPGLRQQRDVRGREIERLKRFAQNAKNWRKDCWDYDDDMDHPRRDFSDDEEWDRLSEQAGQVLDAGKGKSNVNKTT